uniref:Tyrosinase copper-binding domain-containing protein n=1 Tax=Acrobeloides nanus TaxID=290746 RepID=A0A914DJI4_9BILA
MKTEFSRWYVKDRKKCVKLTPTTATRLVCEQYQVSDRRGRYSYCGATRGWPGSDGNSSDIPKNDIILPAGVVNKALLPRELDSARCATFACLCQRFGGMMKSRPLSECVLRNGEVLSKSIRKEYRMLSDDERIRYHNAVNQLKNSRMYELFAYWHYHYAQEGGAHQGPAFALWHREYIKRYEIALKAVDPTVSLPYWDSVLDENLDDPLDSVLWSDELMGRTYMDKDIGYVYTGPFGDWTTLSVYNRDPVPNRTDPEFHEYRKVLGGTRIKRVFNSTIPLFAEEIVQGILSNTSINRIFTSPTAREGCAVRMRWNTGLEYSLEVAHGSVHNFVGGDFANPQTAANDPLFFMLHSFVDYIWEVWRQTHQAEQEREYSYPQSSDYCHSPAHFISSEMKPFRGEDNKLMKNRDALSNRYSEFYEYEPRPSCNQFTYNCGSKYLFCDQSHDSLRCISKVKLGGNCAGYKAVGEDVCYNGMCKNGVCVEVVGRESIDPNLPQTGWLPEDVAQPGFLPEGVFMPGTQ